MNGVVHELLIEPVWNRNSFYEHHLSIYDVQHAFNRTSLESKLVNFKSSSEYHSTFIGLTHFLLKSP